MCAEKFLDHFDLNTKSISIHKFMVCSVACRQCHSEVVVTVKNAIDAFKNS